MSFVPYYMRTDLKHNRNRRIHPPAQHSTHSDNDDGTGDDNLSDTNNIGNSGSGNDSMDDDDDDNVEYQSVKKSEQQQQQQQHELSSLCILGTLATSTLASDAPSGVHHQTATASGATNGGIVVTNRIHHHYDHDHHGDTQTAAATADTHTSTQAVVSNGDNGNAVGPSSIHRHQSHQVLDQLLHSQQIHGGRKSKQQQQQQQQQQQYHHSSDTRQEFPSVNGIKYQLFRRVYHSNHATPHSTSRHTYRLSPNVTQLVEQYESLDARQHQHMLRLNNKLPALRLNALNLERERYENGSIHHHSLSSRDGGSSSSRMMGDDGTMWQTPQNSGRSNTTNSAGTDMSDIYTERSWTGDNWITGGVAEQQQQQQQQHSGRSSTPRDSDRSIRFSSSNMRTQQQHPSPFSSPRSTVSGDSVSPPKQHRNYSSAFSPVSNRHGQSVQLPIPPLSTPLQQQVPMETDMTDEDATERKSTSSASSTLSAHISPEQSMLFESVFQFCPVAMAILNTTGKIEYCNTLFCNLLGIDDQQSVRQKPIGTLFHNWQNTGTADTTHGATDQQAQQSEQIFDQYLMNKLLFLNHNGLLLNGQRNSLQIPLNFVNQRTKHIVSCVSNVGCITTNTGDYFVATIFPFGMN